MFNEDKHWERTNNESAFDVTKRSYVGAYICELADLYISSILGKMYGIQNIGLYRDVLACLRKIRKLRNNKIPKDIIRTFRENFGLKITIMTYLINFLDVTFDLCTGRYQSYEKPNDTTTYINVNSNHPPNIIKALLEGISK